MDSNALNNLKDALDQSPENIPLRLCLARALCDQHQYGPAEQVYRQGLKRAPASVELKSGLAETFYALGRFSESLVICEELESTNQANAQSLFIHAKVLRKQDDPALAAEFYRKAKARNCELSDTELEELLQEEDTEEPDSDFTDEELFAYTGEDPRGRFEPYPERPDLSFKDVGGMEDLKEEIRLKIIHPLTHAEIYAAYGKKIGGGILLYGPPGCGKTYIAKATAGEVKSNFFSISIHDVLDIYIGQSEQNIHDIFDSARAATPAVLFFDEVDALAASRRDMRQSAARQSVNQFLSELDGIDSTNEGLLIIAATNAPWHLDSAFRRPGRFDRILFVPPPDEDAREIILRLLLKDKPAGEVDTRAVARKTDEFSGADLKNMIDVAVEEKLKAALKSGTPEPFNTRDLLKAARKIRPSTREWFVTARNHALYSNQSGLYDPILEYLKIR